MDTIDLGTYYKNQLEAATDDTGNYTLRVISSTGIHELAITDYGDDPSPAMAAAYRRLQAKLDHPEEQLADKPAILDRIALLRAELKTTDQTHRLSNGNWQRKYALHIPEVQYLAAVQRQSRDRAAMLAYADRRLSGAVSPDGVIRWDPFNAAGVPTFWFDEDLDLEDTLYWLWQNVPDLMRVFNNEPPALPYPVDEPWLASMKAAAAAARAPKTTEDAAA